MTLPRSAAEVLSGHVVFELECIDRMYCNLYVPKLQRDLGVVWGSEIRFGVSCGQLGSDVVLVGESAEDLFPADPVLGEVDRFWWPGAGLSWGELAEGAVRPGSVVVPQVLGQHLAQVLLVDDQQPVEELPAQGADDPFADRVRLRAPAAGWPRS